MTTETFTGTNGDPLPAIFSIQTAPASSPTTGTFEINGNSLKATGTIPVTSGAVFYETTGGSADDDISIDVSTGAGAGASSGLAFRQTDGDNYLLACINTAGQFRLLRNLAGTFTVLSTVYNIPAFSNSNYYTIRVVFTGSTIECYLDGTLRLTVSSSHNQTATEHGGRLADLFASMDNWVSTAGGGGGGGGDSITVAEPPKANYIYQRNASNQAIASFSITYVGTPTALKYQLLDASDSSVVTAWATFDASPTGGISTLDITRTASTVEYIVEVRQDDSATITDTQVSKWSVGIKTLLFGQSLAEHLGTQGASGTPASVYKYTTASGFHASTTGAGQAAYAARLVALYGCTVAVANTAAGGTCLTDECAVSRGDGSNYWQNPSSSLYTNTVTVMDAFAVDSRIEHACWIQGQTDAVVAVSGTEMTSGLTTLITQVRTDFLDKTGGTNLPIIMGTLGRNTSTGSDSTAQAIRQAIINFTNADALLYPLPIYPYGTDDGTHPNDAGDLALGVSIADIYNGAAAPDLSTVSLAGSTLTLTFDQDLDVSDTIYSLEGVRVESGGVAQTVSSCTRTGVRTVDIILSVSPPDTTDISVFIGYGTGTSSSLLTYPANATPLFTIPIASLNNDLSGTNTAPVADAGPDQSVDVGTLVTLDGTGSSDADLDTITYLWSITTAPGGSSATLSSTTVAQPTFTPDVVGAYQFTLVVNDGTDNSTGDVINLTANAVTPAVVTVVFSHADAVNLTDVTCSLYDVATLTYLKTVLVTFDSGGDSPAIDVADVSVTDGTELILLGTDYDGTNPSTAKALAITASAVES